MSGKKNLHEGNIPAVAYLSVAVVRSRRILNSLMKRIRTT